MATASNQKPVIKAPECPICLEDMCAPIYQCKSGHSICDKCNNKLYPPTCPICREDMTKTRNWQLEELAAQLSKLATNNVAGTGKATCPNKPKGCCFLMAADKVDNHLKECIFRTMDCPLKGVCGNCTWQGDLKQMMQHCRERHEANCNLASDDVVELNSVDVKKTMRWVYITAINQLIFKIIMKIDTGKKICYWAIQHIGSKKTANSHLYEIHLPSKLDPQRKVMFIEQCFNDYMTFDELCNLGKCAMLPLEALTKFMKDQNLSFMFFIKKNNPPTTSNDTKPKGDQSNKGNVKHFKVGPKGPQQKKT